MTPRSVSQTTPSVPSADLSRTDAGLSAASRSGTPRPILGPCPCQGCRRMVVWNGMEWQNAKGYRARHSCSDGTDVRYTFRAGISGASPNTMCGVPLVADTNLGDAPRLEVSAP